MTTPLEAQVAERLLHVVRQPAVQRVAPARRVVVDPAEANLVGQDDPEGARLAADTLQELRERATGRRLLLPAPARRLSPASLVSDP